MKTIEELQKRLEGAFKHSNFFDSLHEVNEVKKVIGAKELTKFLKKKINIIKKEKREYNLKVKNIRIKYGSFNEYIYEEALQYITHSYKVGEIVVVEYCDSYKALKIHKITKKGYDLWDGNKLATIMKIPESSILGYGHNLNKIIKENDKKKVKN